MTISGKVTKKKAIILSPERLTDLCDILSKHCNRLEFSAETHGKSRISFIDINELLSYDNYKSRRIIDLEITGYIDYSRTISISIGDLNFNPVVNYGSTIRCDYKFDSTDAESIFKSDLDTWYDKAVSSFWLLGKFSVTGLLFIPSVFITLVRFGGGIKTDIDISNIKVILALAVITLLTYGVITLIKCFDTYVLGNLFPAVAFNWGEETVRFEKWSRYRSNLFWGIIMAILLGLVSDYLYDTLKGI